MKKILTTITICFLATLASSTQNPDGNWWGQLTVPEKTAYIIGYGDGDCIGELRTMEQLGPLNAEQRKKSFPLQLQ